MCAFSVFKPVFSCFLPSLFFCSFFPFCSPSARSLPHLCPFPPVILLFYSCLMRYISFAGSLHDLCLFSAQYLLIFAPYMPFFACPLPVPFPLISTSLPVMPLPVSCPISACFLLVLFPFCLPSARSLPHLSPFPPVILLFYSCIMRDISLARFLHTLCLFFTRSLLIFAAHIPFFARSLPALCHFSTRSRPVICAFSPYSLTTNSCSQPVLSLFCTRSLTFVCPFFFPFSARILPHVFCPFSPRFCPLFSARSLPVPFPLISTSLPVLYHLSSRIALVPSPFSALTVRLLSLFC